MVWSRRSPDRITVASRHRWSSVHPWALATSTTAAQDWTVGRCRSSNALIKLTIKPGLANSMADEGRDRQVQLVRSGSFLDKGRAFLEHIRARGSGSLIRGCIAREEALLRRGLRLRCSTALCGDECRAMYEQRMYAGLRYSARRHVRAGCVWRGGVVKN